MIYQKNVKNAFKCIIGTVLVLSLLCMALYGAFFAAHAMHCHQEHCAICLCIDLISTAIRCLIAFLLISPFFVILQQKIWVFATENGKINFFNTPVSLKTKLND